MERPLSILHICKSDTVGGAAIAARRLVIAQRKAGIDARMAVLYKNTNADWVYEITSRSVRLKVKLACEIARRVCAITAANEPDAMRTLGIGPDSFGNIIEQLSPDIVHWHWVGGETIALAAVARHPIPSVWTCHDQWIFRGAENHVTDDRFSQSFDGAKPWDPDAITFRRKTALWADWRPTLICPSKSVLQDAVRSPLARDWPKVVIPNTLDSEHFKQMDRIDSRRELGLPLDCPIILFGAYLGTFDPRKGFDLMAEALGKLPKPFRSQISLAVFGGPKRRVSEIEGIRMFNLGTFDCQDQLAKVYSSADLFVTASRQETFGNTVAEALSCGTRCLGFAVGGLKDIVQGPLQGRLVEPFDTDSFAQAIAELCVPSGDAERSIRHREFQNQFGSEMVVSRHSDVYRRLLAGKNN